MTMHNRTEMTKTFTDQMGRFVQVSFPLRKIVSLVPSQTELLIDLGLGDFLVGRTKFCIHPKGRIDTISVIGGTKNLNIDKIISLRPDIIIGNKEENRKEDIEVLEKLFPIWMSDVNSLQDALLMIDSLSDLLGKKVEGKTLIEKIRQGFKSIPQFPPMRILYLIWQKPYIGVAKDAFINDILTRTGFDNVLKEQSRYPELTDNEIIELKPQVIFLSSEPYPFKEKHQKYLHGIVPDSKVILVDGEMFSWYGSRLLQVPDYLKYIHQTYFL